MSQNHSSTQVLARKWRPRELSALVGQEHVVRALRHALQTQRLHHAYLFTGTRGVGKTTLARILAKALNCETGITDTPCGQCNACREIDQGRFVDLLEVDAATNTGVDEMRDLLENAAYAPTAGRYKVYVIDEVHMLSKSAFNAMLKTLEEPPPHILFILATTDPQKIPVTVLSRCLQFNLKQMPPAHVVEHLQRVLGAEGIAFEVPALQLIGRAAQGSMRDALSLTDQAIAHGAGQLSLQSVQDMLGAVDQRHLLDILEALAAQDGSALLAVVDDMSARSLPLGQALQNLAALLYRLSVAHLVPGAIADDDPDRDMLMALSQRFSPTQLQLYYQIASLGRRELVHAPDEATGFGMCLLRMLAFLPQGGDPGPVTGPSSAGGLAAASGVRGGALRQSADRGAAAVVSTTAAKTVQPMPSALTGHGIAQDVKPALDAIPAQMSEPAQPVRSAVIPDADGLPPPDYWPESADESMTDYATNPMPDRQTGRRAPDIAVTHAELQQAALPRQTGTDAVAAPSGSMRSALDALSLLVPGTSGEAATRPTVSNAAAAQSGSQPGRESRAGQSAAALAALKSRGDSHGRPVARDLSLVTSGATPPARDEGQGSHLSLVPPFDQTSTAVSSATVAHPLVSPNVAPPLAGRDPAQNSSGPTDWPDREGWPTYVESLGASGLLRQMLDCSQLDHVKAGEDGSAILVLTVAVRAYLDPAHGQKLSQFLTQVRGKPVAVQVLDGPAEITAQARAEALRRQRQAQAEAAVESDPFVRSLRYGLGATVVAGSIRPL